MGETQEERIQQFLDESDTPVVGMREGAWLLVEGDSVTLKGLNSARIFRRGQPPVEAVPISRISEVVGVVNGN
jgi:dipeptidase E